MKMDIKTSKNGNEFTVAPEGEINILTAPELEEAIGGGIADADLLTLDFAGCDYVSSAGLRVLLSAQKIMNKQGKMIVRGATDAVMEIFDVTGFTDLLNIE